MLYDNVKRVAKEKGVTIVELEDNLGYSRGSIFKWNTNIPSIKKVKEVAEYLKVDIALLIENV